MAVRSRSAATCIFALFLLAGGVIHAADEGRDDLIRAIRAKLNVRTFGEIPMLGDLDEVIRLCDSALAKGLDKEDTRWANKLLAATLIERGGIYARSAAIRDPKWADYRRLALEDLERALPLDPSRPEAALRIAQLNLELPQGDLKRAMAALDEAIARSKDQGAMRAEALLLRAELQKDPAKQLADLNEAVRAAPGEPALLRARAKVLYRQNKPEEALADLNAALRLDPDHVDTLMLKAIGLAGVKKYDEALSILDEAHKLAPNAWKPLAQRAGVRAMKEDYKGALADCDAAEALSPRNPNVMLLRASIYQQMKDDARAVAEADRLLAARPGDREVLLQLADFHILARRFHKAIEMFSKYLQKVPDDGQVLHARGDALLAVGQHAEAIADYEKALKSEPHNSGLLNNFAWVLATSPVDKLRDGKRAVEMALEACRLTDYRQAHILSTLGAAYAETGDFAAAIKWSEKAVQAGSPDQKADLLKELESYKAGKPVRELKNEEASEGGRGAGDGGRGKN